MVSSDERSRDDAEERPTETARGTTARDEVVDRTIPGLPVHERRALRQPASLPSGLAPLGPIGRHPWVDIPTGDLPYLPYCTVCSVKAVTSDGLAYAYGSGVMIGRRTVLTARHCVLIEDETHGGRALWAAVSPARGYNSRVANPDVFPFQTVVSSRYACDPQLDFAVILLDQEPLENKPVDARPLRARLQYAYYPDVPINQVIVHNLGYPGVHPTTIEVRPKYKSIWKGIGQITAFGESTLDYDIDTTEGNSGSPVFLRLSNGDPTQDEYHVIGIHVEDHSSRGYNRAVRITSAVCDQLDSWRRQNNDLEDRGS